MSDRVTHIYDHRARGTLVYIPKAANETGLVVWDEHPGVEKPVIKEELIFLNAQDRIPPPRKKIIRERDDRGED